MDTNEEPAGKRVVVLVVVVDDDDDGKSLETLEVLGGTIEADEEDNKGFDIVVEGIFSVIGFSSTVVVDGFDTGVATDTLFGGRDNVTLLPIPATAGLLDAVADDDEEVGIPNEDCGTIVDDMVASIFNEELDLPVEVVTVVVLLIVDEETGRLLFFETLTPVEGFGVTADEEEDTTGIEGGSILG